MKRLVILLFLSFASVLRAEELTSVEIPPCGIACTYGVLDNFGLNVSLSDIAKRHKYLFPDGDAFRMPLSNLQMLIQSFGLHTLALQGDLAALDKSYLPAILCITNKPDGERYPVGHVVLLKDIQGNTATCVDYQAGIETYSLSLASLQVISEGKVILVSKESVSLPFFWMLVALWLTVFTSTFGLICIAYSCRRDRKKTLSLIHPSTKIALVLITLLVCGSGCDKKKLESSFPESNATIPYTSAPPKSRRINPLTLAFPEKSHGGSLLLFDRYVQNIGDFQVGRDYSKFGPGGAIAEFEFPFTVGNKNVVIEKIDASCGCVVADSSIIGQELSVGSEQSLKFTMDLRERCGEFFSFVNVTTKPESKEPIMLKMVVIVKQLPKIVPPELHCRGEVGKKVENIELNVFYLRDESAAKMDIDFESSDYGRLRLVHSESSSKASIIHPKEIQDRIHLKFDSKDIYPLGQHEDELTIRFNCGFEPITVPVKIKVVPSVALAVERLFVGEVAPGEKKTMSVRVTLNDSSQTPEINIISTDEGVQVKFDERTMKLHVAIQAPQTVGRFEKKIRLTFDSEESAFDFSISGIVL